MNIRKMILKYIYLLLSVLVVILFFTYFTPFREGLLGSSIGEYDYLAPIPEGNVWSQDTIMQFVNKFNEVNNITGKDSALQVSNFENSIDGKFFINNALEEEAQYYIKNGKWPYDSYVNKYLSSLDANKTIAPVGIKDITPTNASEIWSNRLCYGQVMYGKEAQMTPQPLSYQIYMGTAKPPASSGSSSSSSLSDSNYQQLVSLCKNLVNK